MQKLPNPRSLNDGVTDVQRLMTVSGSVHGVTVSKQCICLHCVVYDADAELNDPSGKKHFDLMCSDKPVCPSDNCR